MLWPQVPAVQLSEEQLENWRMTLLMDVCLCRRGHRYVTTGHLPQGWIEVSSVGPRVGVTSHTVRSVPHASPPGNTSYSHNVSLVFLSTLKGVVSFLTILFYGRKRLFLLLFLRYGKIILFVKTKTNKLLPSMKLRRNMKASDVNVASQTMWTFLHSNIFTVKEFVFIGVSGQQTKWNQTGQEDGLIK